MGSYAERELELMRAEFGDTLSNLEDELVDKTGDEDGSKDGDSDLDLDNLSDDEPEAEAEPEALPELAAEPSVASIASVVSEEPSSEVDTIEAARKRQEEDATWFFSSKRRTLFTDPDALRREKEALQMRMSARAAGRDPEEHESVSSVSSKASSDPKWGSSLIAGDSSLFSNRRGSMTEGDEGDDDDDLSDGYPEDLEEIAEREAEQARLREYLALSKEWQGHVLDVNDREAHTRKLNLNSQIMDQRRWLSLRRYDLAPEEDSVLKGELRKWFTELDAEETGTVSVDRLIEPMLLCGVIKNRGEGIAFVRHALKRTVQGLTFHLFCELVTHQPDSGSNPITDLHARLTKGHPSERLLSLEYLSTQYRRRLLLQGLTSHGVDAEPWHKDPLSPRESKQVYNAISFAQDRQWEAAEAEAKDAEERRRREGGRGGATQQQQQPLHPQAVATRLENQAARISLKIRRRLENQNRHMFKADDFNVMRARRATGSIASLLGSSYDRSGGPPRRGGPGGRRRRRKKKGGKDPSKRVIAVHTYGPGEDVPHKTRIKVSKSAPALPHILAKKPEPPLSESQKIVDSRRDSLGLSYKISSLVNKSTIPVALHAAVGMANGQWGYLTEKVQREERRRSHFSASELPNRPQSAAKL